MTQNFVPESAPLPWFKTDNHHELRPDAIHAANGGIVATTWRIGDHVANGDYILRAVNNFPALLTALEMMVRAFNVKEIDPLIAFASIEKAKHAIENAKA